jgi:hypothetical protein
MVTLIRQALNSKQENVIDCNRARVETITRSRRLSSAIRAGLVHPTSISPRSLHLYRFLLVAIGFAAFLTDARADDIAAETVDLVKKATVFIKVEGDGWGISGSGFAIGSEDSNVLIATNNHVAVPTPGQARAAKPGTITVVFDSGRKTERSYTGTVVGDKSDFVGSNQGKPLIKIGGDGTPVIGIVGKSNGKDMTGMGLLFKGQE